MKPKATIMVSVYNAEEFIGGALESAINQSYSGPYEVLVINDGSTDDTRGKIQWYKKRDDKIRLINQENVGIGRSRNSLLNNSRGEYLLGLDGDDVLESEALEKVVETFERNPSFGMIYTNQREIDKKGDEIGRREREVCHSYFNDLVYHCHFPGHLRAFSKNSLDGVRFNDEFKTAEDWDFLLKVIQKTKVLHIPETLYSYRINNSGLSIMKGNETVEKSMELLSEFLTNNNFYGGRKLEIVPMEARKNIIYYDHKVDGKSVLDEKPEAKKALERYLREGY